VQQITAIINNKHPCQQDLEDDDETQESLDETSEFDWIVIDTALDVLSGLAAALGERFAELWKMYEKTLLRFAGSSENIERATAVGVMAEVITGMKGAVTPFTDTFLRLLIHRLSDEDPQTKSNAAYAVGRLVEFSNADSEIITEFPKILSRLEPCLQQEVSRLPDNTAGCLSRMILKHRSQVPIEDVLPSVVAILPLKTDFEENEPLYRTICQLCKCSFC
jgi:importin-4